VTPDAVKIVAAVKRTLGEEILLKSVSRDTVT
jgi:hypothetical protein